MTAAHPPGRRTESLFDNRYRYDHIFPRGRSGETLRAYDTHNNDRPVVIKRPAPQDAPPMRAGQEVSIRTERQALERLAGHDVLVDLQGRGTFRIGGHTHEYIVMDLAQGSVIETLILEQTGREHALPMLEMLVIIDQLLDLLAHAHEHQVIYNDVDAKHLFWDRNSYRLKVIDWGNAVFLDEPGALHSVSRATDIYQCGELLYFILTGGNRLSTEMDDDSNTFFVNFGPEADHITPRLQTIITHAVHSDLKRRYSSIAELRSALSEIRAPLEKERDDTIVNVSKRVRPTASQEELNELQAALQSALDQDPGYPPARELSRQIETYLRQIEIQADLDAIRIYLESGNWTRALALLNDLLPTADEVSAKLIRFLMGATATLDEMQITPPPAGFIAVLDPLFAGDAAAAGQTLLTTHDPRSSAQQAQWLLAEQLTVQVPSIVLLRPHLPRLRITLAEAEHSSAALDSLNEVETALDLTPVPGLTGLRVLYQQAADHLSDVQDALPSLISVDDIAALEASAERAQVAISTILDYLNVVSQQAFSDPEHAETALRQAVAIDPTAEHFDALHEYFDEIRQTVSALGQFRPRDDGRNLTTWFEDVRSFLVPYATDLADAKLHSTANALQQAAEGWTTAANYMALGRRQPTIDQLRRTAELIRPFNENIAAWFGNLANRVPDAVHVENLIPKQQLAERLIQGWAAWDRGDCDLALRLAQEAYELTQTGGEQLAVNRLRKLSELLAYWLSNDGLRNTEVTDRVETETVAVLLTDEEEERQTFAEQMPNTTLYLRAMNRGIVAWMKQSSSAGWRALYLHYTLRGVLSLRSGEAEEAEFWRNAASKTFEGARTHPIFQVLDRTLTSRRLVETAERALNGVSGPHDLEDVRQALNAPLAGDVLAGAEQSVQGVNDALRSWADGEFYNTQQSLESALADIGRAIERAELNIESYVTWLTTLRDAAADLHQTRLQIEQSANTTSAEPDPALLDAHEHIVTVTVNTIGQDYAHQVRQWRDMYRSVLNTYTATNIARREKIAAFSRYFASLFITRHPAYPLFRHWEALVEQLPDEEIERGAAAKDDYAPIYEDTVTGATLSYLENDAEPEPSEVEVMQPAASRGSLPWNWITAIAGSLLLVVIVFALLRSTNNNTSANPTREPVATEQLVPPAGLSATDTPEPQATTQTAPTTTPVPATTVAPTNEPTATHVPTNTAAPLEPTATPTEPARPTVTPTMFVTETLVPPSPTPLAIAAAPQDAMRPQHNILDALENRPPADQYWSPEAFGPGGGASWLLDTSVQPDNTVTIDLTPELLSALFQPGAASSLIRADAVMELVTFDDAAMAKGDVAIGLGAMNNLGQSTIGQVQYIETSFVSVGLNQNGRFSSPSQYPQQNAQIKLSIRRTNANSLSFFIDDRQLGESVFLFTQTEPITLLLYASGRNVTVGVSDFTIDFSPRSELP